MQPLPASSSLSVPSTQILVCVVVYNEKQQCNENNFIFFFMLKVLRKERVVLEAGCYTPQSVAAPHLFVKQPHPWSLKDFSLAQIVTQDSSFSTVCSLTAKLEAWSLEDACKINLPQVNYFEARRPCERREDTSCCCKKKDRSNLQIIQQCVVMTLMSSLKMQIATQVMISLCYWWTNIEFKKLTYCNSVFHVISWYMFQSFKVIISKDEIVIKIDEILIKIEFLLLDTETAFHVFQMELWSWI